MLIEKCEYINMLELQERADFFSSDALIFNEVVQVTDYIKLRYHSPGQ